MRILLWIGSFITEELSKELQTFGYRNTASFTSQKSILEGLESVCGQTFDSIGAIVLQGYPVNKKILFHKIHFHHAPGAEDILVGFLNVEYINRLASRRSMVKSARNWLNKHNNNDVQIEVFVYEMRSACIQTALVIKQHTPSARIHLIIPDLPSFMDLNMGFIKKTLKAIDWIGIKKMLRHIDDFILYAEPMADFLSIRDKKWTVMEGSVNVQDDEKQFHPATAAAKEDGKIVVMYSGFIDVQYGILDLINAFQFLDNRYELWITGSGPSSDTVKQAVDSDNRISFYGFLPSRDDLMALQQQATMMMNMRYPDMQASNYCFPSKIFEYMLSGKPVLSCRLGGIPTEYFDYLVEMERLEPESIGAAIRRVAEMPQQLRTELGIRGREFVLQEKNNLSQARKIMDFISTT